MIQLIQRFNSFNDSTPSRHSGDWDSLLIRVIQTIQRFQRFRID